MLKPLVQLLGDDVPVLHRYVWMAVFYGLLSGLTLTTLVPVLGHLLAGDRRGAALWLLLTLAGMAVCWACRRRVERAGVAVAVAILQGARQRIGDHVARLPLGWFTAQNTGQLGHVITQGMMAVAQLPAHVFTPVITGAVTPLVIVVALFAVHWPLGLIALLGLPVLAVALLSVSDSLSLPEPFSRPEVQILMIFLGVLLMLPAAVVVILQVAKRLAPQLMNRPPQYSRSEREKDNDANH